MTQSTQQESDGDRVVLNALETHVKGIKDDSYFVQTDFALILPVLGGGYALDEQGSVIGVKIGGGSC